GAVQFHSDISAGGLISIADLSTVWVSSDVPEPFLRLIHIGEPVEITFVAYPGETFTGRVARVGTTLDPQTRTLKVYVDLPNPSGPLRPRDVRPRAPQRPAPPLPHRPGRRYRAGIRPV